MYITIYLYIYIYIYMGQYHKQISHMVDLTHIIIYVTCSAI